MIQPLDTHGVSASRIHCSIKAEKSSLAHEIRKIAQYCAIDLKLSSPLAISEDLGAKPHVILTVDIESALAHQAVWRLAGRIASFCPQARVSTQILPSEQFKKIESA